MRAHPPIKNIINAANSYIARSTVTVAPVLHKFKICVDILAPGDKKPAIGIATVVLRVR